MDATPDGHRTSPIGWASSGDAALNDSPSADPEAAGPPMMAVSLVASTEVEGGVDEEEVDDSAVPDAPRPRSSPTYSACIAPLDVTEPLYVLPYEVGDAFEVRQATCGPVTHRGAFSYAYDFDMASGTPVLAARGGVVASVVEGHPENTNRSSHANYVVLKHDDGQYSRYLHLRTSGVEVAEGDTVLTGDMIAFSGNSGRSSRPHLHFDVTNGCGRVSSRCPTLPITFMNADEKAPRGGQRYAALPY